VKYKKYSPVSGYYKLIAKHSGRAVVVAGASTANGADVIQYAYGGSNTNDEWQLVDLFNGYHRVVNRNSGKVMNVAGASTANNANVDQWSWANVNQQQFQLVSIP
jgi:DhnA family fructose-bisphosphate aldolase class Ia